MTIESFQYHSSTAEAWTSQGSNCCMGSRSSQDLRFKASQLSVLNTDTVRIQSMLELLVPPRSNFLNWIVWFFWIVHFLWSQLMIKTRTWSGDGCSLIDRRTRAIDATTSNLGYRKSSNRWTPLFWHKKKNRGQYTRQVTNSPVWGGSAAFPTYTGRLVLPLILRMWLFIDTAKYKVHMTMKTRRIKMATLESMMIIHISVQPVYCAVNNLCFFDVWHRTLQQVILVRPLVESAHMQQRQQRRQWQLQSKQNSAIGT